MAELGHITRRITLEIKQEKFPILHGTDHVWSTVSHFWALHFDKGNGTTACLDKRSTRYSGTCYYNAEGSRKVLPVELLGDREGL